MRVTIRKALARLPKLPTQRDVVPAAQFTVAIGSDSARDIAAGIRALAARLRAEPKKSYVRLLLPHAVESARRYGPVRFVAAFVAFPREGAPGMRYRLDVGCL